MADGDVAAQATQGRLVEHLAHEPEGLVDDDRGAVGHRDPGRLLTAVLEGVQAEVRQLRDLLARRPDTEDATGVLRSGSRGVEVVRQPSITARHASRLPASRHVPTSGRAVLLTTAACRRSPTDVRLLRARPARHGTPTVGKALISRML